MFYGKKIVSLLLALAFLSAAQVEAASISSSSTTTTAPAGSPISFTFLVVPQLIRAVNGHNEIKIAATLAPAYSYPKAQVLVSRLKGRTHFSYSKPLRKFMKSLSLTKSDFKPLETYLKGQLSSARTNLVPFVTNLATYLQTGTAPVFTLSFQQ